MRGALLVLTLTLSPLIGWTAGVCHARLTLQQRDVSATTTERAHEGGEREAASTPARPPAALTDSDAPAGDEDPDATPAVATYTHDGAGTLYEEHSPQTEVARLREPVG